MDLTDSAVLKMLAKTMGLRPSPNSGQHFLIDRAVLDAIVAYASIGKRENILEIGPGFGALTRELVLRSGKVLAVEMDARLSGRLKKEFSGSALFEVLQSDILKISNQTIAEHFGGAFRVVSNIPYQITGKIIRKFVSDTGPKPSDMLILVQKEVAERVCAKPGRMNLLAIATQVFGKPSLAFTVPKEAFWPMPKVASALLCIAEITEEPAYPIRDIKRFWQVARVGFSSPRKQLHNNLAAGLHLEQKAVESAMASLGLLKRARAQELSIEAWVRLSELL